MAKKAPIPARRAAKTTMNPTVSVETENSQSTGASAARMHPSVAVATSPSPRSRAGDSVLPEIYAHTYIVGYVSANENATTPTIFAESANAT